MKTREYISKMTDKNTNKYYELCDYVLPQNNNKLFDTNLYVITQSIKLIASILVSILEVLIDIRDQNVK